MGGRLDAEMERLVGAITSRDSSLAEESLADLLNDLDGDSEPDVRFSVGVVAMGVGNMDLAIRAWCDGDGCWSSERPSDIVPDSRTSAEAMRQTCETMRRCRCQCNTLGESHHRRRVYRGNDRGGGPSPSAHAAMTPRSAWEAAAKAIASNDAVSLSGILSAIDYSEVEGLDPAHIRFASAITSMIEGKMDCAYASWDDGGACWSDGKKNNWVPSSVEASRVMMGVCGAIGACRCVLTGRMGDLSVH